MRKRDPAIIEAFESKFERIGIPALILQVITGLTLAYAYLPDVSKWFSFETHVATHIFVKLVLLVLTLALALDARLRIIPKLSTDNLTSLALHILAVTLISVLFVAFGAGIRTGGLF
jgi:putative copper export protein